MERCHVRTICAERSEMKQHASGVDAGHCTEIVATTLGLFGWTENWLISAGAESPSGPAAPKTPSSRSAGLKINSRRHHSPSPSSSRRRARLGLGRTCVAKICPLPHPPSPSAALRRVPFEPAGRRRTTPSFVAKLAGLGSA
jgi:hypothetical protein